MSDNDLASEDEGNTNNDEVSEPKVSPGNPFKEVATHEDETSREKVVEQVQTDVTGNTNDSINTSLDGIKDVDVLKSMVIRLRHENGNHRQRNKEVQIERDKLLSERVKNAEAVVEANERADAAERKARGYMVKFAAEEYSVDEDLIDVLERGSTEEEVFELARRVRDTKKRKPAYETTGAEYDPFTRRQGKPVRPSGGKDPGGEWLRDAFGS